MRNVTKDTVQKEIDLMFRSHAYYSFFMLKCPKCGKRLISLHIEHGVQNSPRVYEDFAYFWCSRCGKKIKKRTWLFDMNKKVAKYCMPQFSPKRFYYKGNDTKHLKHNTAYDGLQLNKKEVLLVFPDKNVIVPHEYVRILKLGKDGRYPI
jgi:hypothetical protein